MHTLASVSSLQQASCFLTAGGASAPLHTATVLYCSVLYCTVVVGEHQMNEPVIDEGVCLAMFGKTVQCTANEN